MSLVLKLGFGLGLSLLFCLACDSERNESDACIEARELANSHVNKGDLPAAEGALSAAEEHCGKASDYAIDRLRRAVERERRHQEREAQILASQDQSPLSAFLRWVKTEREEKNRAKGDHSCAERNSKEFGFCTSRVATGLGGDPFSVRYFKSAPDEEFVFRWQVQEAVTCVDTGPHRVVSEWQEGGTRLQLCELMEHGLLGLKALLSKAGDATTIEVFSAAYLRRDPAFARRLNRE